MAKIRVEKFENSDAGIYMILNTETKRIYIGQSKNLKRRMVEHLLNLYSGNDNNLNLQEEFRTSEYEYRVGLLVKVSWEELNKYESIYFQAAQKYLKLSLYNSIDLTSYYAPTYEELYEAQSIICNAIERINVTANTQIYTSSLDVRFRLQDWVGKDNREILKIAQNRIQQLKRQKPVENTQKPELDFISIQELYENNELDYIIIGKMGDYFGYKDIQSFADILGEKIGDLSYYKGKCLWAAAGPDIDTFKELQNLAKQKQKKVYAFFCLTLYKYRKTKENDEKAFSLYQWEDNNGNKYFDTAPRGKKYYKGLVINHFWTVKEAFPIQMFEELYYRYERKTYGKNQKILPNDVSQCVRTTMQAVVSKKEILNDRGLQRALALDDVMMKQFKKEKISKKEEEYASFITCSDEPHPVFYILAEVSDYVKMKEINEPIKKENL